MNSCPAFTVSRSEDPDDAHAPFMVLKDGQPFLDGLQEESEARSICELLRTAPLNQKVVPIQPYRLLAGMKRISTSKVSGKQRGQALLEVALTLPILILLLLGGMDLLFCETANGNIAALANQGAACIEKGGNCNAVAYVQNAAPGLSLNLAQLTVTQSGNTITVAYAYLPLGPVFPQVNLSATATAP